MTAGDGVAVNDSTVRSLFCVRGQSLRGKHSPALSVSVHTVTSPSTMSTFNLTRHENSSSYHRQGFQDIENDVEALSVSESATSVEESVLPFGAATGRAIQSLGEAVLHGVEKISTVYKMRHLESMLQHKAPDQCPVEDIQDLLELQR